MRTVGVVASVIFLLLVLGFVAMFIRSLPDLARYLRLRKM